MGGEEEKGQQGHPAIPGLEHVRHHGGGTLGRVDIARDAGLKRLVVVKTLREELAEDETSRKRFVREAQAAARISHPNVSSVYTIGETGNGQPYMVMEFVDGRGLDDILAGQGPYNVAEATDILCQLSEALAAAHEQNIVHRDVKPANVIVANDANRAVLTDFGLAAILTTGSEAVTRLTSMSDTIGDQRYMSPEQLRGDPVTGQADMYGLGIVAYELLTGKGPFDDQEVSSMANAHLRRQPTDLSLLCPGLPAHAANALMRCLAKRPEHRPRAAEISRALRGEVDTENTLGPFAQFLRELKRRKVYQAAVAYIAIMFIALQGADLLVPALQSGATVYRYAVLASLCGFPIAVALAWVFDLRKGRLVRTGPESDESSQRKHFKIIGVFISIAIAAVMAAWYLRG